MCSRIPVQQANQAVFLALMKPGDTFMGLNLAAGGHLTHGASVNMSGKWFNVVPYNVNPETHLIDMEEVERLAHEHKPKIIVPAARAMPATGISKASAASVTRGRVFHGRYRAFRGVVAGGSHPSPFPHAHVVTSTTHKTLRGPRGGIVLTNDPDIAKKINSAVFPGLQGGPLMHVIAAKAVAFNEALQPEFKTYAHAVVANAKALAETLKSKGFAIITGGTDNHLMLVDLRPKKVTGVAAEKALGRAHITCNKNGIPFDPEKPMVTSGIRLGSPAATSRGFGVAEFQQVGNLIAEVIDGLAKNGEEGNGAVEEAVKAKVHALTAASRSIDACRPAFHGSRLDLSASFQQADAGPKGPVFRSGLPRCAAPSVVPSIRR